MLQCNTIGFPKFRIINLRIVNTAKFNEINPQLNQASFYKNKCHLYIYNAKVRLFFYL